MDKFIAIVSCDSQSSSHGVREKLRKPTSYIDVGYSHSTTAVLHSALKSWKKGKDLWSWKTFPKELKFLEVEEHAHKSFKQELKYDKNNIIRRLKNIPYTHFYYMTDNTKPWIEKYRPTTFKDIVLGKYNKKLFW